MEAVLKSKYQPNLYQPSGSVYEDSERLDKSFFNQFSYTSSGKAVKEKSYIESSKIAPKKVSILINDKLIEIPVALKHIAEQIEEAKEILKYGFDWDEEGAIPTDAKTFGKAASFVKDYTLYLFRRYGIALTPPYIDILRDGAVSVHWETSKTQFLIIFKKENHELAYYFAERKDNKVPFKSAIEPGKPVDEFLALWMKKNLI